MGVGVRICVWVYVCVYMGVWKGGCVREDGVLGLLLLNPTP